MNDEDITKKFQVRPSNAKFEWDGNAVKYHSKLALAAGANETFEIDTAIGGAVVTPGVYSTTIELFVPSV